jgi:ketosteroid isomerase-like protein
MSANVDLVRSIFADWERGDFSSAEWADSEIEYVENEVLDAGSMKGKAAMAERWRSWLGAWEEWRVEAEEYVELDHECVLVPFHFDARGKASGLELGGVMRVEGASLFHLCGGKVTRLVQYRNRDRAFADLGLAPEGGSPDTERPR